jgi:glycosyltransferase involved in cell wall biosynthesis
VAGDATCLVDPLDVAAIRAGLERIIGGPAYRDDLVERGYRNVLRFDPDVIANAYLDIYRRVAAR